MNLSNINRYYTSIVATASNNGINEEYTELLLSVLFYRGARKNLEDTMYHIKVLQDENKEAANMFLSKDKLAGTVSDDTYTYSGTGKEFGLQKVAAMAYYLPNNIIGKFKEMRSEKGKKKKANDWLDEYCFEHHGKTLKELVATMRK